MAQGVGAAIGAIGSALINAGATTANNMLDYNQNRSLMAYGQRLNRDTRRTTYQDMTYSMRQAGINPLYSVTGGQAPVPSVGVNSARPSPITIGTDVLNGIQMLSQLRNQTNATNADVALKGMQVEDLRGGLMERIARIEKLNSDIEYTRGRNRREQGKFNAELQQLWSNVRQIDSLTDLNVANAKYSNERSRGFSGGVKLPFGIGVNFSGNPLNPYSNDKGHWVTEYSKNGKPYRVFQYY